MDMKTDKKTNSDFKRKTLADIFHMEGNIEVTKVYLPDAVELPNAGTETSLSAVRTRGLEMVLHPSWGIIGCVQGKYFNIPVGRFKIAS